MDIINIIKKLMVLDTNKLAHGALIGILFYYAILCVNVLNEFVLKYINEKYLLKFLVLFFIIVFNLKSILFGVDSELKNIICRIEKGKEKKYLTNKDAGIEYKRYIQEYIKTNVYRNSNYKSNCKSDDENNIMLDSNSFSE